MCVPSFDGEKGHPGPRDSYHIDDRDYYGNKRLELAGQVSLQYQDLDSLIKRYVRGAYHIGDRVY